MKLKDFLQKARDKLKLSRKATVLLCLNVAALVLAAVFFGLFSWAKTASTSQRAARLWANGNGERYAQVSAFIADGHALTHEGAHQVSSAVTKLLKENFIEPRSDSARLFNEAFSGTVQVGVSNAGKQVDALATGIGGDFFFFHGFELLHGSLIHGDDVLTDVVVIDDQLAWRLYGASNVVGFEITVGGKLCYVGGVVSRGDKWPDSLSYGELSRIFVNFDKLKEIAPALGVTCFEAVLPDPVSGFGLGIVAEAVKIDEPYLEIVENSNRYGVFRLLGETFSISDDAMQTKAIALPYWENAARAAASWSALFLCGALLIIIFPIICLLIMIVKAWRKKDTLIRAIVDRHRQKQMEKWEKREKKEQTAKEEVLL